MVTMVKNKRLSATIFYVTVAIINLTGCFFGSVTSLITPMSVGWKVTLISHKLGRLVPGRMQMMPAIRNMKPWTPSSDGKQ